MFKGRFDTNRRTYMRYHGKGIELRSLPDIGLTLTPMSTSIHQLGNYDWQVFIKQKCFVQNAAYKHLVTVSLRPSHNVKGFSFSFREKQITSFGQLYNALDKLAHEGIPAGFLFFGTEMALRDQPKMSHYDMLRKINEESYEEVKDFYPSGSSVVKEKLIA